MNPVSRKIPQAQISLSLATDKQVFGHSSWCYVYITLAHSLRLAAAARPLELEELGWLQLPVLQLLAIWYSYFFFGAAGAAVELKPIKFAAQWKLA